MLAGSDLVPARPDFVLLAIPALAASGLAIRTVIAVSGFGTALLGLPLAPAGYVAALVFLVRELFVGPTPTRTGGNE